MAIEISTEKKKIAWNCLYQIGGGSTEPKFSVYSKYADDHNCVKPCIRTMEGNSVSNGTGRTMIHIVIFLSLAYFYYRDAQFFSLI